MNLFKRAGIVGAWWLASLALAVGQEVKLKTLAISEFSYKANREYVKDFESFPDMLRTEFAKTRRFTLVERDQMKKALAEQGLTEAGLVNPESAKRIGKLTGADYILYGSVAEAEADGRTRGQEKEYRINIDMGIMDSESGEIKLAEFVDARDIGSMKQVIRKVIQAISKKSVLGIYPITIAAINDSGEMMLNYGEDFIERSTVYDVFAQGEPVRDPATGAILAREEKTVGQIKITSATGKFSKAVALGESGAFKKGMICRPSRSSESAPTARQEARAGDSEMRKGAIKVVIGEFRYSKEFDLQQNKDRSKSVNTSSPSTGQKGILGTVAEALVGDGGKSGGTRNSAPGPDSREKENTAIARKSDVLRELVTTRIVKAGQFEVLERARLDEVKGELNRDADGDFDIKQMAERGQLAGADYLIVGTITKLSQDVHNTGYGAAGGANTVWIDLNVELRIVDTRSGNIKIAETVAGSVETTKESTGFMGFGTAKEQTGAMGDLLANTAEQIVSKVTTTLRPITIIDVSAEEGLVTVNYGEGFIKKGESYSVYSQGQELKDPYTGARLGFKEKQIGEVRAVEVTPKFSKCAIVGAATNAASAEIKTGMICRPKVGGASPASAARPLRERTSESNKKPARPEF